MKRLPQNVRDEIKNRFALHTIYKIIKESESSWFKFTSQYRLSAEQVFYEVMITIDNIKEQQEDINLNEFYNRLFIDYQQDAYDVPNEEIKNIISIIVSTTFSVLATSRHRTYQQIAKDLALQCAANDEGYSSRLGSIFSLFDQSVTTVSQWLDIEYMHNPEFLSATMKNIEKRCRGEEIIPSIYFVNNHNMGKTSDEVHKNLKSAAQNGPTALLKYLCTSEGKIYFDFRGDPIEVVIQTFNEELGTSLIIKSIRRSMERHIKFQERFK